jgi:hypothetical protein
MLHPNRILAIFLCIQVPIAPPLHDPKSLILRPVAPLMLCVIRFQVFGSLAKIRLRYQGARSPKNAALLPAALSPLRPVALCSLPCCLLLALPPVPARVAQTLLDLPGTM